MITTLKVRDKNLYRYEECVSLRKQGLSYGEIRQKVSVAKSTLNNWLTLAGLTLTAEHLQVQKEKRKLGHVVATEAARITKKLRSEKILNTFIGDYHRYIADPAFVSGVMLYEAEGSKADFCFSNSDYRVIRFFVGFLEKYFRIDKTIDIGFRLYIHKTRNKDLPRILEFWSSKLGIPQEKFRISWKRNITFSRKDNGDYVGQMTLRTGKVPLLTRKILAISDIILRLE